jgi:hypothetical protein
MAREKNGILDTGDTFPTMTLSTLDHGDLQLPTDLGGRWGVLLVYRGQW